MAEDSGLASRLALRHRPQRGRISITDEATLREPQGERFRLTSLPPKANE